MKIKRQRSSEMMTDFQKNAAQNRTTGGITPQQHVSSSSRYFELLHLVREPFPNSPTPELFYPSHQHMEALHRLEISLHLRRGLSVVLGDVGTGKTTICRQLQHKLTDDASVLLHLFPDPLFNSGVEFLRILCDLLEIKAPPSESNEAYEQQLMELIKVRLFELAVDQNKTVVFIFDEGQRIPTHCLELLRLLLNYDSGETKLLQIVIFAQNEFENAINKHKNFTDRIDEFIKLDSFDFWDTIRMISYRLEKSSETGSSPAKFSFFALVFIFFITRGFPRKVIALCQKLMLMLIVTQKKKITASMVLFSFSHLKSDSPKFWRPRTFSLFIIIVALVAGIYFGKLALPDWQNLLPAALTEMFTDTTEPSRKTTPPQHATSSTQPTSQPTGKKAANDNNATPPIVSDKTTATVAPTDTLPAEATHKAPEQSQIDLKTKIPAVVLDKKVVETVSETTAPKTKPTTKSATELTTEPITKPAVKEATPEIAEAPSSSAPVKPETKTVQEDAADTLPDVVEKSELKEPKETFDPATIIRPRSAEELAIELADELEAMEQEESVEANTPDLVADDTAGEDDEEIVENYEEAIEREENGRSSPDTAENSAVPNSLGYITVQKGDLLSAMICGVYGEYRTARLKHVIAANPSMANSDVLRPDKRVLFPIFPISNSTAPGETWLQLHEAVSLDQGYKKYRELRMQNKDVVLLPNWSPEHGLKFPILIKVDGAITLDNLNTVLDTNAKILTKWPQGTLFFGDKTPCDISPRNVEHNYNTSESFSTSP